MARTHMMVLFQHGSHGCTGDFKVLRRCLEAAAGTHEGSMTLTIFETDVNARLKSDAGVEVCTERLLAEFLPVYKAWAEEKANAAVDAGERSTKLLFSAVGHSFGGIILRRAVVPILADATTREHGVVPSLFVTIATPHLGVTCSVNPIMLSGALLIGRVYSQTYLDLLDHSGVLSTTLVDDDHIAALRQFTRRVLFANVVNDHLVGFETASLAFDLVDAVNEDRRQLPPDPLTPHVLPKRLLGPLRDVIAPPTAGRSWKNPAHWLSLAKSRVTADLTHGPSQAMAARLRAAMAFELYPVCQRSWFPSAHNSVMCEIPGLTQLRDVLETVAREVLEGAVADT